MFCDKLVWALANNSHTATSFVRTLLVNLFPLDVLLKSNLRGRSKDTTEHRPALDATKIDAIYSKILFINLFLIFINAILESATLKCFFLSNMGCYIVIVALIFMDNMFFTMLPIS